MQPLGIANSVTFPPGVIRPMLQELVNQRLPSEPGAIPLGVPYPPGSGYSVTLPCRVIFPIWFVLLSVNQRLPSGPAVIHCGLLLAVGIGYSVKTPLGVTLPIWFALISVNQRLPSGPRVIPDGWLLLVGIPNSVTLPAFARAGVTLTTRKKMGRQNSRLRRRRLMVVVFM